MKLLKFTTWVKEFGVNNLAVECGVGPHQVRVWMRGQQSPRSERLIKIIKLSENKLKLDEVIWETTRSK